MFGFDRTDYRMIYNFFKINLKDRYMASALGGIWAVLNPIIMLGIFTFIFGFVYRAKLPGATTTLSYVIWLISGYGPWLAISEGLLNSANSVVSNSGVVKNMAFKTEILPVASILVSIVPLAVSLGFLSLIMFCDGNIPTWHALMIFPVVAIMYFFMIGLGFFLAAITVFLRDLAIVLPNLLMMVLFVSPIFYTIDSMPKPIQMASVANPFYILTEGFRQPLVYHQISLNLLLGLSYVILLAAVLYFTGLHRFRKIKGYFTSVI
ncbi:ABC transporter permease [Legionella septentrionalis]|nr:MULTISPECIES: ABC transporter permease [Legionella]MCP0914358.1 ABC transporter permease [Legionella sp. 27cVA30]RUR00289.1 ABC transporter permease [Legionella septentrionalis]RUR11854.1 ABC transporter permease [Legionella septentrionalis]RUR17541.1 ABC transporter permease [Legionella septentrionalis]